MGIKASTLANQHDIKVKDQDHFKIRVLMSFHVFLFIKVLRNFFIDKVELLKTFQNIDLQPFH